MKLKFLHKRKEEKQTEKEAFSLPKFIIERSRAIEIVFLVLVLISALMAPFVEINYDLTEYLPSTVQSKQGLDLMEEKFGYPGTGRIMIDDVSLYEAKAYKDKIEALDGVDQVMWLDTSTSVYAADAFINFNSVDEYYKDNTAVMDIVFVNGDTDKRTSQTIDEIKDILGDKGHYVGMAVQNKSLQENVSSEMKLIMTLAVVVIFLILTVTTNSWFEPVLYLTVMGVAIVLNKGTNLFIGRISFLTNSVSAVLQLACSMDYSIFLSHAFAREKAKGLDQMTALSNAINEALNSIFASSLTTIVGFIVLCFMKFNIGFDMGLVLAKGIVLSLLTVVFFMPAMILRMTPMIEKTSHRSFLPSFDKLSHGIYNSRRIVLILIAVLVIPAYTAQSMNDFLYGNDAVGASEGTTVYEDDELITAKFGRSNMMMAIVPDTSFIKEKQFTDELEDLPYMKSVTSLSGQLPEGVPEDFLPYSITSQLHKKDYARILIYVKSKGESKLAYQCSDEIQAIMKKYYPENSYLVGTTPSTQDIQTTITKDYSRVNVMSLIGVFVVVMWSFKSLIIPLLIMIPIEVAIFVNMAVPYIVGDTMIFIGYIIVSCIQLGATVDYAILTTNNYLECRKTMDKKEAAIGALNLGIPAILTSGSILTCAGYIVYKVSSVAAIGDLGHLIGRGALISMLFVCSLMPAFLVLFDHILMQNEFERIHLFFKKRRERRHARMKRAARRMAGAVWKGKKPLVDSVTSKRKQFEAETKALEDTEMTETGGSQEKTDSDAEAREKHRRKLRLLGKVRERRKDRKRKMTEKREAGSHEEDH